MSAWGWLLGGAALFLWAEARKRPIGAMTAGGGTGNPLALATIGAQTRTARAQAATRGSSTPSVDALRFALPLAGATLGLASTLYKQIAGLVATGNESQASRLVDHLETSSTSGALDHLAEFGGAQTVPASNDDLTMITDLDAGSATTDALDHLAELSAPTPPPDTLGIPGVQVLSPSVAAVDVGDALDALTIPTADAETAFQGTMQSAGPSIADALSLPIGTALGLTGTAASAAGGALGADDADQLAFSAAKGAVSVGSQVAPLAGVATDVAGIPIAPVVQFALGVAGDATLQSPSIITTPVQILATAATNIATAGTEAAVAGAGGAAEAAGLAASAPAVSGAAAAGVLGLATVPLIVGALIDMFDQPSRAWLEFPSKVFTTDNETRKANYQLLTDLVNAQTQGDIVNAIAAWKAWIGQRVGGFGAGSAPYDLPIPPGSDWEIHGEPVALDQYYDPSAEMAGLEAAKQAALAGQSQRGRLAAYKNAYAPIAAQISAQFDPARVAKWVAAGIPDPGIVYRYDDAFLAEYVTEIYTTPYVIGTEGGDMIFPPPAPTPAAIAAVPSLAPPPPPSASTQIDQLVAASPLAPGTAEGLVNYYRAIGLTDDQIIADLKAIYSNPPDVSAGGG